MTDDDLSTPHARPAVWWSDRWAWRGALAAAPLGALAAIVHALVVLRVGPPEALTAYAVGALLAAGVGCLLGGSLGASWTAVRHRGCTPVPAALQATGDDEQVRPAELAAA